MDSVHVQAPFFENRGQNIQCPVLRVLRFFLNSFGAQKAIVDVQLQLQLGITLGICALPSAKLEMITTCVRQLSMEFTFKHRSFSFLFYMLLQRSGHRCALCLEDLKGMTR
jgi:hypothetical protein